MSLSLLIVCGVCTRPVPSSARGGGVVLSCGDFLCEVCAVAWRGGPCSACGKDGVRCASLNGSLPDEVKQNMADPSENMESVHNVLCFQIRYYKHTIKKLLSRLDGLDQQSKCQARRIEELEARLASRSPLAELGRGTERVSSRDPPLSPSPRPHREAPFRPSSSASVSSTRSVPHDRPSSAVGDGSPVAGGDGVALHMHRTTATHDSDQSPLGSSRRVRSPYSPLVGSSSHGRYAPPPLLRHQSSNQGHGARSPGQYLGSPSVGSLRSLVQHLK